MSRSRLAKAARGTQAVAVDEVAIVAQAAEVLGMTHVGQWMRTRIPSLGGRTPVDLVKTIEGQEIERVLLRIEHGVY